MMRTLATAAPFISPLSATADEKKEVAKGAGPLELKILLKKDTIIWDADEKTRKEFKAELEEAEKNLKKKPPKNVKVPLLPVFEATIQIKNTGDKDVTIQVDGDNHTLTLDLKGPGVIVLAPLRPVTLDFRVGRAVTLKPGETFDISIQKLNDGFRRISRDIFWTDLGEYSLTASLKVGGEGEKVMLLKSKPVKFKVEERK